MTTQSSKIDRLTAWRSKAFDFSFSDQMGTLVSRALELMISVVRNGTNVSNAEHFVRSLEFEQKLAMERDPESQLPVRELVYILCEGLGLTIDSIIESKSIEEQNHLRMVEAAQEDQMPVDQLVDNEVRYSLSNVDNEESADNSVDDGVDNFNYQLNSVKYENQNPYFDEDVDVDGSFDNNDEPADNIMEDRPPSNQALPCAQPTPAAAPAATPGSVEGSAARPKRAAAAAAASKMVEECNDIPVAKRSRTEKEWDNDMQCPQCDKMCRGVNAITIHLQRVHGTTPRKTGIVFLCKCGNETVSNGHANTDTCGRSKSTVLIKRQDSKKYKNDDNEEDFEDKNRRVDSIAANQDDQGEAEEEALAAAAAAAKTEVCDTPAAKRVKADNPLECPQCDEVYRSVNGLVKHLKRVHDLNPTMAGILFKCGCGKETASNHHYHHDPCGLASGTVVIDALKSSN